MPASPLRPPPAELRLGLGFYATATAGVGGRLKLRPGDFLVQEISLYPKPDAEGPFTVLKVESQDWEQHELAQTIASRLGLPPHAIQYAGTKDRRAVAERLFSYRGPPPAEPLALPRVRVLESYRSRDGLVLGHHFGNRFDIALRSPDRPLPEALAIARATLDALGGFGGVPNFFGPQRFGEVRPVTHEVGRCLVQGNPEGAVDAYLTLPGGDPASEGELARRRYAEHRDPARALREFPPSFRFERALLDHLARGHAPARALSALSRELRTLFVHAYQSLLFNRYLSRRFSAGLSLTEPESGDRILRVGKDGTVPGNAAVPVETDNLTECRELVRRGGARLAGPLVGFGTPPLPGRGGALLDEILAEEGVDRAAFRLPRTPEIASAGAFRPLLFPVPVLALEPSELPGEEPTLRFRFALPKGAYATVLLREFQKLGSEPSGAPA